MRSEFKTRNLFHEYVQSECIACMTFRQYQHVADFCDSKIGFEDLCAAFPVGQIEEINITRF